VFAGTLSASASLEAIYSFFATPINRYRDFSLLKEWSLGFSTFRIVAASSKGLSYHTNVVRCLRFTADIKFVKSGDQNKKNLMKMGIFANLTRYVIRLAPQKSKYLWSIRQVHPLVLHLHPGLNKKKKERSQLSPH